MAIAVAGFAASFTSGLYTLSLTLIVVSPCMQAMGRCFSSLLSVFNLFTELFTVLVQSRRLQTPHLRPEQVPGSEAMGSDTPTLYSLAPERETVERPSEDS